MALMFDTTSLVVVSGVAGGIITGTFDFIMYKVRHSDNRKAAAQALQMQEKSSERAFIAQQAADIRKEMREESLMLRKDVTTLRDENTALRSEVDKWREENIGLKLENAKLTARIVELESRLVRLKSMQSENCDA